MTIHVNIVKDFSFMQVVTNCRNPLLFGEVIRGNGIIKMYFGL